MKKNGIKKLFFVLFFVINFGTLHTIHAMEQIPQQPQCEKFICSICQAPLVSFSTTQKEGLESSQELRTARLSCGHTFHLNCVQPHLLKKHSCPICRKPQPTPIKKNGKRQIKGPLPEISIKHALDVLGSCKGLQKTNFAFTSAKDELVMCLSEAGASPLTSIITDLLESIQTPSDFFSFIKSAGNYTLIAAIDGYYLEMIQFLLLHGASQNPVIINEGQETTPLHFAIRQKHIQTDPTKKDIYDLIIYRLINDNSYRRSCIEPVSNLDALALAEWYQDHNIMHAILVQEKIPQAQRAHFDIPMQHNDEKTLDLLCKGIMGRGDFGPIVTAPSKAKGWMSPLEYSQKNPQLYIVLNEFIDHHKRRSIVTQQINWLAVSEISPEETLLECIRGNPKFSPAKVTDFIKKTEYTFDKAFLNAMLFLACFNNTDPKVLSFLEHLGADWTSTDMTFGTNPQVIKHPLYKLCEKTLIPSEKYCPFHGLFLAENDTLLEHVLNKISQQIKTSLINTQTSFGRTPLHIALAKSNILMVGVLLKNNANLSIKDYLHHNALHTALLTLIYNRFIFYYPKLDFIKFSITDPFKTYISPETEQSKKLHDVLQKCLENISEFSCSMDMYHPSSSFDLKEKYAHSETVLMLIMQIITSFTRPQEIEKIFSTQNTYGISLSMLACFLNKPGVPSKTVNYEEAFKNAMLFIFDHDTKNITSTDRHHNTVFDYALASRSELPGFLDSLWCYYTKALEAPYGHACTETYYQTLKQHSTLLSTVPVNGSIESAQNFNRVMQQYIDYFVRMYLPSFTAQQKQQAPILGNSPTITTTVASNPTPACAFSPMQKFEHMISQSFETTTSLKTQQKKYAEPMRINVSVIEINPGIFGTNILKKYHQKATIVPTATSQPTSVLNPSNESQQIPTAMLPGENARAQSLNANGFCQGAGSNGQTDIDEEKDIEQQAIQDISLKSMLYERILEMLQTALPIMQQTKNIEAIKYIKSCIQNANVEMSIPAQASILKLQNMHAKASAIYHGQISQLPQVAENTKIFLETLCAHQENGDIAIQETLIRNAQPRTYTVKNIGLNQQKDHFAVHNIGNVTLIRDYQIDHDHIVHDFSPMIDHFLHYGLGDEQTTMHHGQKENTYRIRILGAIQENGAMPEPCIFEYCFNKNGECYHRYCDRKISSIEILKRDLAQELHNKTLGTQKINKK
ncbi:MAG: hypothetical protein UU47_C0010G0017 [candidate division TM6 bacterium GW2011_GWE2_41_16]|nr:MAG: hypothetical protein UU47_C0010G0017 [candidate division TM6 bacterium GW2011_GWE2_41_16]